MKLKVISLLLCLMLISGVMAQDADRPYEGVTLNFFYFPLTYIVGCSRWCRNLKR